MSTSEAGSKIQYLNFIILLAILVLLVIGHLGEDKISVVDPDRLTVEATDSQKDPISKAAVAFLVGENGTTELVNKKAESGKKCTKAKGKGVVPTCAVFKEGVEVQDIVTFSVLKTKGSHVYTQKVGAGQWDQICYDDNWNIVDCSSL